MDEELLPTGVMPITVVSANLSFPTSSPPPPPSSNVIIHAPMPSSSSSMYPNLQQEIMSDDHLRTSAMRQESIVEEVNGHQPLRMSPSNQSHRQPPVTAANANSGSYLSTASVNYSGGNVTFHSSPHRSKTNRKKSRKLTLTQVCSDGSQKTGGHAHHQQQQQQQQQDSSSQQQKVNSMDADRISNSSSLIGFDSDNSATTASTSSSLKSGPERKINRIFSMLQSMQQTFLQQNQGPPQQPPPQQPPQQPPPQQPGHHHHQGKLPKEPIYEQPHANRSSDSLESGTDTIHSDDRRGQQMRMELQSSATAPSRQLLYGLGRSQDSLMSTRMMTSTGNRNNFTMNSNSSNSNNKGPIYASWNGSQYSTNTYTTMTSDGAPPPPMTHAMPYHKDGWTSLFIVGSSTYAQLLIVMCMVAALSEVVTHNVSFLYFETFFAFLYTVSIIFFLYVFGYLLRSKRRREERKRLRKLSRWKESNMANPSSNGTTTEDETSDYDNVQVDRNVSSAMSVENEIVSVPSPLRRFFNNFSGERRRFSRSDPSETDGDNKGGVSQNPHPSSRKTSGNKQQWMPQNFSLVGGGQSPGEIVSYSTMTNSDIVTTHRAAMNGGRKAKKTKVSDNEHSHGSLFLRAGAVAFGLGTMIYDGLEFGAFLEVPPDSPCFALLRGLNPLLHAAFVFLQMYFIFISARLNIHKFKVIARFGLMHCVATNVCVWIRTLVRESLKEINGHYHYYDKKASHQHQQFTSQPVTDGYDSASNALLHHLVEAVAAVAGSEESFEGGTSALFDMVNETFADALAGATTSAPMASKGKKEISLWELTGNVSCGRRIFLGNIIMDAAPFLYPFLIEYSLIGAAVLYVIWEHIGLNPKYKTEETNRGMKDESIWNSRTRQLRVDCVGASKGLFMGLFFLTASLLCLVLFFIFVPMPQFKRLGLILGDSAHCTLLFVSLIAMAIGAYRARNLHFHSEHMEELGSILLRISALGIFAYSAFSMIAGALGSSTEEPPTLVFVNGLLSVIEVTVQTIFISDMSRRSVNTVEQDLEKPGRQSVTFLLITNLTLWLVYTFEMQKVEANPVQLNFYGFLPWAIVQRISLPLCIFYRFHSAMVYAEIWKNSFRYHGPPMEETMAVGGS